MTVEVLAPAKVNLTLHVTGRRSDGYHLLNSLVVFAADVGDHLSGTSSEDLTVEVTGPLAGGVPANENNIILKAARLLQDLRGVKQGAHITVEKYLPNAAGLGGGSSDATATIKLLSRMWDVPPLSPSEALVLGADVPVCMGAPAPAIMSGIGEELGPVTNLPDMNIVLAKPNVSVPTLRIFDEMRRIESTFGNHMTPLPSTNDPDVFIEWLKGQRNDLLSAAQNLAPEVTTALKEVNSIPECAVSGMSGSGATVWGLFKSIEMAEIAKAQIAQTHPDWWCAATRVS